MTTPILANSAAIIGTNYYYGNGYITNVVKGIDTTTPDGTFLPNTFFFHSPPCLSPNFEILNPQALVL
jgi:hypothetical protein